MERFRDQAIVLSTVDYGEADRLAMLLTRSHGRLTAFAAGARKSRRRFAGALEPFMLLDVQLVERRGETFRLDGADIVAGFHSVRTELPLIARAMYCLELCRELTRDREPHPRLFALLVEYLELLDRKIAGPTSLIAFELEALTHAGFRPRFSPCASCGQKTGQRPKFDPEHGGVLCDACAESTPHGVPLSVRVVESLAALQSGARQVLAPDVRAVARKLLNVFIAHHVGWELRSVDFMAQVGVD